MQLTLLEQESEAERKFQEFHGLNPDVYKELMVLTWKAREAGRNKIGIGMLFEVLRWNRVLRTTDSDFKLNNNYRSRYARLIMTNEPRLNGMFEIRELHDTLTAEWEVTNNLAKTIVNKHLGGNL